MSIPFRGDDPRWKDVDISRVCHRISAEVGVEVSPIWYTPDMMDKIWAKDAEVLIWRRDMAEGVLLVGDPAAVLGEQAFAVLAEPLTTICGRAIGARRYHYSSVDQFDEPYWCRNLEDLNRILWIGAQIAANAVCYVRTGHNERRPMDSVLMTELGAVLGFAPDVTFMRITLGQCISMDERDSALEALGRLVTASNAYLDRYLPLDASVDPVNLRERLGPVPIPLRPTAPS